MSLTSKRRQIYIQYNPFLALIAAVYFIVIHILNKPVRLTISVAKTLQNSLFIANGRAVSARP